MSWWVPATLSLIGGVQGYNAAQEAEDLADERRAAAERQALLDARRLEEQSRRQAEEDYRLRSAALARAAASGATVEGSVADYLEHMEEEQRRQLEWLNTAGAMQIRLNLEGEMLAADAMETRANAQAWQSLIGGFVQGWGYLNQGGFFDTDNPTWDWGAGSP